MINKLPKHARIRFKDCDPMGHLFNTRFIEYMLEAREEQLLEYYQFSLFDYIQKNKKAWVILKHEIHYLKEAMQNETVLLDSELLACDSRKLKVEYQMWNVDRSSLKALLWTEFMHVDLVSRKSTDHDEQLMNILQDMLFAHDAHSIQQRIQQLLGLPNARP